MKRNLCPHFFSGIRQRHPHFSLASSNNILLILLEKDRAAPLRLAVCSNRQSPTTATQDEASLGSCHPSTYINRSDLLLVLPQERCHSCSLPTTAHRLPPLPRRLRNCSYSLKPPRTSPTPGSWSSLCRSTIGEFLPPLVFLLVASSLSETPRSSSHQVKFLITPIEERFPYSPQTFRYLLALATVISSSPR
ncbi:hypothetical protein B296_00048757 [Ensete ventricosum]|uniref:Uncharacterized protein n=1 Tax=Ensete ventricosum TaxID=4639 RepID=A0A426XHB8_ENSVE|nr:hypothetical protein B296_00048757 [Ensete ventricosum]